MKMKMKTLAALFLISISLIGCDFGTESKTPIEAKRSLVASITKNGIQWDVDSIVTWTKNDAVFFQCYGGHDSVKNSLHWIEVGFYPQDGTKFTISNRNTRFFNDLSDKYHEVGTAMSVCQIGYVGGGDEPLDGTVNTNSTTNPTDLTFDIRTYKQFATATDTVESWHGTITMKASQ